MLFDPPLQYDPCKQAAHDCIEIPLGNELYVPAAHGVHSMDDSTAQLPIGQIRMGLEGVEQYDPAGQRTGNDDPIGQD